MSRAQPLRASLTVAAIFAAVMASTTVPTPLYPIYERDFGLSPLQITVVFAVYGVGVMTGLFVFGRLSDHSGRKPPLAGGLLVGALAMVLFLLAQEIGLLLAGRFLIGITAGLYTGTATAWLVDLDDNRDRATKLAIAANLGGLAMGPLLAGLLAQYVTAPLRTAYVVELVLILGGLAVFPRLPETVRRRRLQLDFAGLRLPAEVRTVFLPAATAGIAAFGVSGVFGAVGPAMLGEILGITAPTASGLLVTTLFLTSVAGQFLTRRFVSTVALPAGCVALAAGLGLVALSLAAASVTALAAAAVIVGLAQGLIVGAGLGLLTVVAPVDRRGQVASAYFLVLYIGLIVPVVGFGLVQTQLGLTDTGELFCLLVGLSALVSGLRVHSTRQAVAGVG
ncbi:MAG TPA: MFS transporter [Gaiellales bacterium]|jgi:MFS family permease|nr:MFS transporter [Gaiellales bacterium]